MSLYAELIQSRIIGRIARGGIILKPSGFAEDSGSNLDYSGGRKTHRFPPPYGLGSLSLTHRPTENPTGVTHWLGLQGILNHAPLFRMTTKATPLRDTPHPDLPQSGEGAFCRFPLNLERGFARYPPQLGEGEGGDRSFHSHSELRP